MSSKGKRKKKQEKKGTLLQQITEYGMQVLVAIYVFCMLCVYPLYFDNKYYNMGDAKFLFFETVSCLFIGIMLVVLCVWIGAYWKEKNFVHIFQGYSVTDWFVVAFLAASYFSFLYSENQGIAFYGYDGWNMGLLSQVIFILIYFFVSRYWKWSPSVLGFAIATGGITALIAVLQRFSIDILNMYEGLGPEHIEKFVSTLGQTSWYSSYAVLIFPFGAFWYWHDDQRWSRILSAVFIVVGSASLCTVNSDSAYVAYLLIFMVFFWYSMESNEKFGRFLELALLFLGTCKVVGIFQVLFPERMITLITGTEEMSNFMTQSPLMLVALIVVAVLYAGFRYLIAKGEKEKKAQVAFDIRKYRILRKIMVIGVIFAVWLVVLLIILTTRHKLPGFLEGLYNIGFLNFTESWGNHRGFNWRMAFEAIKNSTFKDFLIGVGPDCFVLSMDKYCLQEVDVYWQGMKLVCAHNEWLNMLVTEGVIGVTAYMGIFISLAKRLGKCAYREPAAVPCIAAILAYMGYNIFCYQQCICTPTIFIFMGIGEMIIRNTEQEVGNKKS